MQIFILLSMIFFLLIIGLNYRRLKILFYPLFAYGAVGCVFAIKPDITNVLAANLGVGRGADLIIYMFIIASNLIGLILYLKVKRFEQDTATLTIALAKLTRKTEEHQEK